MKQRVKKLLILSVIFLGSSKIAYTQNLQTGTTINISKNDSLNRDSIRKLACIEAFITNEALKADKDSCVKDNTVLRSKLVETHLTNTNLNLTVVKTRNKLRLSQLFNIALTGIIVKLTFFSK